MTRMTRSIPVALVALGTLVVGACGDDDDTATAGGDSTRTVEIDMVDIAFEPEAVEVERGETVRFVFTNTGAVAHDAFIGDTDAQVDHEAEMREADDDGHGGGHGDGDSTDTITVQPGGSDELTHTFDESGSFEIACHQPGHYDAGMIIDVTVS